MANDSEFLPRQMIASVGYAFVAGNGVPKGGIIMWSGTTVPDGWSLCDGTNGTPDLRERFIIGAGKLTTLGSVGGNSSVNIDHTHPVGMSAAGVHAHSGVTTGPNDFADRNKTDAHTLIKTPSSSHVHTIVGDGSHAHPAWTGSVSISPTVNIRPPYYALAFIMKQ